MPELTRIVPAGTTVNFTEGEYSDFALEATGVALKDCDIVAAVREWKATLAFPTYPSIGRFVSWLFGAGGYFRNAPVATWHVGSYGAGDSMRYEPPEEVADGKA